MTKVISSLLALCIFLCGCEKKKNEAHVAQKVLRVACDEDPQTLDPRLARTLSNMTFIKMFYEGLMVQGEGELLPGVATEVDISKNGKVYTFTLRDCCWSNGDKVTAEHFANAWKSLLAPDFPAPMAYQFFLIKGAKEAKEGTLPIDRVGVYAKDEKTLVVELNEPAPYFLEMTTMSAFSPLHPGGTQTFNGPFQLDKWVKSSEVQAVKNPRYWDAENVKLDRIIAMALEENTALKMFQAGELDWAGSPLSSIPVDAKCSLKAENKLQNHPAAGTHYFSFNTGKPPMDNVNLRKALSLAINREDIVTHITQGNQTPATGFVPLSYGLQTFPYFEDHNVELAKDLFAKAVEEMGGAPQILLSFASNDLNSKIAQAVQQQWKEVLGIDVQLDQCESKLYSDRMRNGDFMAGLKSWYGDFRDPINFLEMFKNSSNGTNNTAWENKQFTELLNLSTRVTDKHNRMNILRRAEKILVTEMPVAPLYYNCYNYVKKEHVKEVYFSDMGFLDFKRAVVD